jgi:hypothetical protein
MNLFRPDTHQKALLHSLPFAILLALCFTTQAQVSDTKASLLAQEQAAQSHYAQTLNACAKKIASAECSRQAQLDFKQTQHTLRLKREALDVQAKRDKLAKSAAEKADNVATAKQGIGADGKPLARTPLAKPSQKNKTAPAPLSKTSPPKAAKPKAPMTQRGKPAKGVHSGGSLTAQPTPEQRRDNVAKFASKEQLIALRKTQSAQKKSKRQAKDDARRAAGYTVDKP